MVLCHLQRPPGSRHTRDTGEGGMRTCCAHGLEEEGLVGRSCNLAGVQDITAAETLKVDGIICDKVEMAMAQDPLASPGAVTINLSQEEWDGFGIDNLHYLDFVTVDIDGRKTYMSPANGDALAVRKEEARQVRAVTHDWTWFNSSDVDHLF